GGICSLVAVERGHVARNRNISMSSVDMDRLPFRVGPPQPANGRRRFPFHRPGLPQELAAYLNSTLVPALPLRLPATRGNERAAKFHPRRGRFLLPRSPSLGRQISDGISRTGLVGWRVVASRAGP